MIDYRKNYYCRICRDYVDHSGSRWDEVGNCNRCGTVKYMPIVVLDEPSSSEYPRGSE